MPCSRVTGSGKFIAQQCRSELFLSVFEGSFKLFIISLYIYFYIHPHKSAGSPWRSFDVWGMGYHADLMSLTGRGAGLPAIPVWDSMVIKVSRLSPIDRCNR